MSKIVISGEKGEKLAGLIFGLIFTIGGLAALILGIWGGKTTADRNARCTKTAIATIVDYNSVRDRGVPSTRLKIDHMSTKYTPVYMFTVEGVDYLGSDSDLGISTKSYPEGANIEIHYDPDDPTVSYFVDTSTIKYYAACGAGGLFLLIGILALSGKLFKGKG